MDSDGYSALGCLSGGSALGVRVAGMVFWGVTAAI